MKSEVPSRDRETSGGDVLRSRLWYATFRLGRTKLNKTRGAFLGDVLVACLCLGACLACVRVFGGVNDRGFRSHGKECTKSDDMHCKSEAVGLVGYIGGFPGINLNVAQPAA